MSNRARLFGALVLMLVAGGVYAQSASLLDDLNLDQLNPQVGPECLEYNGKVYFTAEEPTAGEELFFYDGNTVDFMDLNPGSADSSPSVFRVFNNKLYFVATTAQHGREWREWDGSTLKTIDIWPGPSSSSKSQTRPIAIGPDVYFYAGTSGNLEPVKWDGSTWTTIDVNPGGASSGINHWTEFNGDLYFVATHASYGTELCRYDGTSVTVIDAYPGTTGIADPDSRPAVANGAVYYAGGSAATGVELCKYDGHSLTIFDIEPGASGSNPHTGYGQPGGYAHPHTYPYDLYAFAIFNGDIYFLASTSAAGAELYYCDGTSAVMVDDINPGSADSNPSGIVAWSSGVYFTATAPNTGDELYWWDGSNLTLIEVNPGPSDSETRDVTQVGNEVWFIATDPTHGFEMRRFANSALTTFDTNPGSADGAESIRINSTSMWYTAIEPTSGRELYHYDGSTHTMLETNPSTRNGAYGLLAVDIGSKWVWSAYAESPSSSADVFTLATWDGINVDILYPVGTKSSDPMEFVELNGDVYFIASDRFGRQVFRWDGVTVSQLTTPSMWISAQKLWVAGGRLYFRGYDSSYGSEVFTYDGATLDVIDIYSGSTSSDPQDLTVVGNQIYCSADTSNGLEAVVITGTSFSVIDVVPGSGNSIPEHFVGYGSGVMFSAWTQGLGRELHYYDGSTLSTIDVLSGSQSSNPTELIEYNGMLYFVGGPSSDRELFSYNGSTSTKIELNYATGGSDPTSLMVHGGRLYMIATVYDGTGSYGREVVWYNGTNHTVVDVQSGSAWSMPDLLTPGAGSDVYFAATSTATGREVWSYSGATLTPLSVEPGSADSSPTEIVFDGGTVYFAATSSSHGTEVYYSSGSSPVVIDVISGGVGSSPTELTAWQGNVWFASNSDANGRELWKFDGSLHQVDVNPGVGSSSPTEMTALGHELYFGAYSRDVGVEPRRIVGNQAPVIVVASNAPAYVENAMPVVLDPMATFSDPDGPSLSGGWLEAAYSSVVSTDDVLSISTTNNVRVVGTTVEFDSDGFGSGASPVAVGTVPTTGSGSGLGGASLRVEFNQQATPAIAEEVLRAIAFHHTTDDPAVTTRLIDMVAEDSDGGISSTSSISIAVQAVNDLPVVTSPSGSLLAGPPGGPFSATLNLGMLGNTIRLAVSDMDNTQYSITSVVPSPTAPTGIVAPAVASGLATTQEITWGGSSAFADPDAYTWSITIDDGVGTVTISVELTVLDAAPVHSIGADAIGGSGTLMNPYYAEATEGTTPSLMLVYVSDPNTSQTLAVVSISPSSANPSTALSAAANLAGAGGDVTVSAGSVLTSVDVGPHDFEVTLSDGTNTVDLHVRVGVVASSGGGGSSSGESGAGSSTGSDGGGCMVAGDGGPTGLMIAVIVLAAIATSRHCHRKLKCLKPHKTK